MKCRAEDRAERQTVAHRASSRLYLAMNAPVGRFRESRSDETVAFESFDNGVSIIPLHPPHEFSSKSRQLKFVEGWFL